MPRNCPPEVYKLMTDCWGEIGGSRKQPQAVTRDINRIRYQVYNSRSHAYAIAFPKRTSGAEFMNPYVSLEDVETSSVSGNSSIITERTFLPFDDLEDNTEGNEFIHEIYFKTCFHSFIKIQYNKS